MGRKKLNSDNNLKFRLNRVWASIKDKSTGWDSVDEFMKWASENGYKPWKVIDRYDKDEKYSEDNCFWKLDGSVRKLNSIQEEDSPTNVCRYIKKISYSIEMDILSLTALKTNVDELLKSENIADTNELVQLKKRIGFGLEKLVECRHIVENIDIKLED